MTGALRKGAALPRHPRGWKGSVGQWLADAVSYLERRGVPEAPANAEFIMAAVLKTRRNEVKLGSAHPLRETQGFHFWELVAERGERVPLAYVLGTQDFMGLEIAVTPDVLVPRPETEELVAQAQLRLGALGVPSPVVLEIGTGSGCIAIALAKTFPAAVVYATEASPAALALAQKNAEAHGLGRRIRFIDEDIFKPAAASAGWVDLLISNPPYIPSAEVASLEPEVRREPALALDGGPDGLDAVRAIAAQASLRLKRGGCLLLEIGCTQGAAVRDILSRSGGQEVEIRKDLQGLDRIAAARFG